MAHRSKKWLALPLAVCACLFLTGCLFNSRVEDLFSLPQLPGEYTELKNKIDTILSDGAEYSAPLSGTNVQPVQMVDLDGDGVEEAVAFFRKSSDEKPLKIGIFRAWEESYELASVIEGSGTSIYSVSYTDLDGDGGMELTVGWRINNTDPQNLQTLQALSVYKLEELQPRELLQKTYARYIAADLNGDGLQELIIIRSDEESNCTADYYQWEGRELEITSSARVSTSVAELSQASARVSVGTLQDGQAALFVTGVEESSIAITDILMDRGGELVNITQSSTTGISTEIFRYLSIYPQDIDGDGLTEVPVPTPLPTRNADGNVCYRVDWRGYSPDGTFKTVLTTCHDVDDGWYLVMPASWNDQVLVTREETGANEITVTFATVGDVGVPPQDFLRIYSIATGDGQESKAVKGNRFVLSRRTGSIFSAEILEEGTWGGSLTEEALREAFYPIQAEWSAGDN